MTNPAIIGDNADATGIIKRWLNLLAEQDDIGAALKDLKEEAKGRGFSKGDMKAMAIAVREHRKAIDPVLKINANKFFADSGGQYQIFAE
jgi:uncharacterized protein (UPF0335 family)